MLQCLLRWIRACCIKHEANRQNIFNADIFNRLKKILTRDNATASEVRDACSVIRALVLDDDIRHEYGKAHEHATVIARGALDVLTGLLSSKYYIALLFIFHFLFILYLYLRVIFPYDIFLEPDLMLNK